MPCDVFISYSHVDEAFPSGWVSALHTCVDAAIRAAAPGLRVEIFRDALHIRRNEDLNARITALLDQAHVLLCVLSPNYTHSRYCNLELEHFRQHRRSRKGKLSKVLKQYVPVALQPEALQNLLGFNFFDPNGTFPALIDAGQTRETRAHPRFEQAVGPLADEIIQAVEAGRQPPQRILVLSTNDRNEERCRIVNDLRDEGIEVVSAEELPGTRRDRREALVKHAAKVEFTLLLLGGENSSDIVLVYDTIEATWRNTNARRCLCAIPPAIDSADAVQRDFLARVRDSSDVFDVVEQTEQAFPETLRLLNALREQANRVPTVYLTYPKASRQRAEALRQEIRAAYQELSPDRPIRLLDPYGDGDGAQTQTQTRARDMSLEQSHGAVVLIEEEGHYAYTALGDLEGGLKNPVDPYIAIYPGGPKAKVDASLARRYSVIVPPRYPWLSGDARTMVLSQFLSRVQERAAV
jgi:hypothetical protein